MKFVTERAVFLEHTPVRREFGWAVCVGMKQTQGVSVFAPVDVYPGLVVFSVRLSVCSVVFDIHSAVRGILSGE